MSQDLRVRRTREQITRALVELINDRGFRKVTVAALIQRAHINRSTFYAHYTDKYDLLDQTRAAVYDRVRDLIDRVTPPEAVGSERWELIRENQAEIFTQLARYLYQERPLVLALSKTGDFYTDLKEIVVSEVRRRREELHLKFSDLIPADYAEELIMNSMLDLVYFWIRKEKPEPPREFVQIFNRSRRLIAYQLIEAAEGD